jgi:hypothetical protein
MAEPVSPLPTASPRNEPVPWPNVTEPVATLPGSPEISGGNARPAVNDLPERFRSGIQRSYEQAKESLSHLLSRSERRFRYLVEERPIQVVAGVAIASLLTGAALRIWRSNHD